MGVSDPINDPPLKLAYSYVFVTNELNTGQEDLKMRSVYRFKTDLKISYLVYVELYVHNVYVIKFHQKRHTLSPNKYKILTGEGDSRKIFNTCINICIELLHKDPLASFGFIGENSIGEAISDTKRYRVYKSLVTKLFGTHTFSHLKIDQISAYLLLNNQSAPDSEKNILEMFKANYPRFNVS